MPKTKTALNRRRRLKNLLRKADRKAVSQSTHAPEARDNQALARLAEGVWRLKRRVDGQNSEDRDWAEPIIAGLNHELKSLGVETIDRTGTTFRDGETTEVVHNEATADWEGQLVVTEVVRPTIRVAGTIVQAGQVVLGPKGS